MRQAGTWEHAVSYGQPPASANKKSSDFVAKTRHSASCCLLIDSLCSIRPPDTGRRRYMVNPGFTVRFDGWTDEESHPLLNYLWIEEFVGLAGAASASTKASAQEV